MPERFWQDILFDFKVGAVIDLTPADGQLARAALQARIPYTGLVFTRRHADELLQRLQSFVLARATREGGTWYDPRLVESLTASTKPKANEKAQTNATSETNAGTKPQRKKRARPATKPSGTGRASKTENLKIRVVPGRTTPIKRRREGPKPRRMPTPKLVILSCHRSAPKAPGKSLANHAGRTETDPGP